jgi:hypothetical protein
MFVTKRIFLELCVKEIRKMKISFQCSTVEIFQSLALFNKGQSHKILRYVFLVSYDLIHEAYSVL